MALGSVTITPGRAKVVDYSFPYWVTDIVSFVSHEPGKMPKEMSFLWPYTGQAWAGIGALTIVVTISVYLVADNLTVSWETTLLISRGLKP
jgi:hypothetical protein